MKQLLLGLPLLALCLCAPLTVSSAPEKQPDPATQIPAVKEENFSGAWLWAEGDRRFRLVLTQKDDVLTGFHSSEREGGGKKDMVDGGHAVPSINGQVHGQTVVVRFKSGFPGSEAYGHARLTLRGRYLYWQLMDATGEHYLPDNAVLIRQGT